MDREKYDLPRWATAAGNDHMRTVRISALKGDGDGGLLSQRRLTRL